MFFLFLLLTAALLFFLFRTGRVGPPPWAGRGSPEAEAKKVLAERFARGDIIDRRVHGEGQRAQLDAGHRPVRELAAGQEGHVGTVWEPGRHPVWVVDPAPAASTAARCGCLG